MKCVNHPNNDATAQCSVCKELLCDECRIAVYGEKFICKSCASKINNSIIPKPVEKSTLSPKEQFLTDNKSQSSALHCTLCNGEIDVKDNYTEVGGKCYCSKCYENEFNRDHASNNSQENNRISGSLIAAFLVISMLVVCIMYTAFSPHHKPGLTITEKASDSDNEPSLNYSTEAETKREYTPTKYNITIDDLPKYEVYSFENISSQAYKRMRFKITLSDRKINENDVINIGKHFYNILIAELDAKYGLIDGFQIMMYGKNDYHGSSATVGSISYNINGSKEFMNASVIKNWDGVPSERDFRIVGELMELLNTTSTDEDILKKQVGDHYGITAEEVYQKYIDISPYYYPKSFDID